MVHTKNYATVSTFVTVIQRKLIIDFFFRTRCIDGMTRNATGCSLAITHYHANLVTVVLTMIDRKMIQNSNKLLHRCR